MITTTVAPSPIGGGLLTVEEAGGVLRVCRSTVYQLMDAGRLQSVRIPGVRARRIPREAIDRLIEAGLTGGDGELV